jgi:hypothetical protein
VSERVETLTTMKMQNDTTILNRQKSFLQREQWSFVCTMVSTFTVTAPNYYRDIHVGTFGFCHGVKCHGSHLYY